ncbi:hypothetical protein M3A96_01490 [Helcobacillus massiliensis]|uniref:hypothetical protein n=2 Tax=Helcobacillus TaxID=1161125 RepID=UPI0021A9564D|nr:hypothetical protein [Helcobacillus massiliensis]MCT1556800.1 hypothetical protein [Helcobacillus massiliensis]MCT2035624.1 hypothetical protein [Helcobacillus massiliensis]MCT2330924.1 hypothetical protein [Helcobacillus massiliensis]
MSSRSVNPSAPSPTPEGPGRITPAPLPLGRLWVKPVALFLVFTAIGVLLTASSHPVYGAVMLAFGAFMAFWTSPLRRGLHEPLAQALTRRTDGHGIILWAPSNKGSAQMQVALRSNDDRFSWVNVVHDADARTLTAELGGLDALPIVLVGERTLVRATSGEAIDAVDGVAPKH